MASKQHFWCLNTLMECISGQRFLQPVPKAWENSIIAQWSEGEMNTQIIIVRVSIKKKINSDGKYGYLFK